ncbi:MAG: CheR family methyltransferase, partial [Planctomycetota bacterium]
MSNQMIDLQRGQSALTDSDFHDLSKIAQREFGLNLSPTKKPLIQSRLSQRLRALGVHSFTKYIETLNQPKMGGERLELISALTTNVTSFFREMHHFTYLQEKCVSTFIELSRKKEPIRIWSAACSTGEEAYSISASILSAWPDAARHDVKILATDIDPKVIEIAEKGEYTKDALSPFFERVSNSTFFPSATGQIMKFQGDVRNL